MDLEYLGYTIREMFVSGVRVTKILLARIGLIMLPLLIGRPHDINDVKRLTALGLIASALLYFGAYMIGSEGFLIGIMAGIAFMLFLGYGMIITGISGGFLAPILLAKLVPGPTLDDMFRNPLAFNYSIAHFFTFATLVTLAIAILTQEPKNKLYNKLVEVALQ